MLIFAYENSDYGGLKNNSIWYRFEIKSLGLHSISKKHPLILRAKRRPDTQYTEAIFTCNLRTQLRGSVDLFTPTTYDRTSFYALVLVGTWISSNGGDGGSSCLMIKRAKEVEVRVCRTCMWVSDVYRKTVIHTKEQRRFLALIGSITEKLPT